MGGSGQWVTAAGSAYVTLHGRWHRRTTDSSANDEVTSINGMCSQVNSRMGVYGTRAVSPGPTWGQGGTCLLKTDFGIIWEQINEF